MFPGNANLPIGVLPRANREIGVPKFAPIQFMPTVLQILKPYRLGQLAMSLRLSAGQRGPVPAMRRPS
jgi:hypothetical protein